MLPVRVSVGHLLPALPWDLRTARACNEMIRARGLGGGRGKALQQVAMLGWRTLPPHYSLPYSSAYRTQERTDYYLIDITRPTALVQGS